MELIKDRITEALRARDMLPIDLARRSGIDKGSISKYLKGDVLPKQSRIAAMANVLNVSPAWLMGYNVPMERDEIDLNKLSDTNLARLKAYYDALIDSQNGNT